MKTWRVWLVGEAPCSTVILVNARTIEKAAEKAVIMTSSEDFDIDKDVLNIRVDSVEEIK